MTRVRTEPVQQRSAARVDTLLTATAQIVDEVGLDRLTTAMVAERAGSSIGTVYRYFPDRVVLLAALRDRTLERVAARAQEAIRAEAPTRWIDAVDRVFDTIVEAFRSEPGIRILRFDGRGDGESDGDGASHRDVARLLAEVLTAESGLGSDPRLVFHLEVALEITEALTRRAFRHEASGDAAYVDEAHRIVHDYLAAVDAEAGNDAG